MPQYSTPLIDREVFFGNPEISSGTISPDGKFIAFLKAYEGIMNVYVKGFDEDFDDAQLLTNGKSPIMGFFWTYDSTYILFINDNNGDENFNVFKVNPNDKPKDKNTAPDATNLTPLKEVTTQIYNVSRNNPDIMMVGINDRDKAWHDLYRLQISSGKLELIHENTDRLTGWNFDWDENPRLAYRTDENGWSQILRVDGQGEFHKIYETDLKESAYISGWNEDNSKFYLVSNKGNIDLSTLYLMDPKTETTEIIESDPEGKVDFGGLRIDRNTRKPISTAYVNDKKKYYWLDESWEADYNFLLAQFPGREISFTSSTKDYEKLLFATSSDKFAAQVYYYNRTSKEIILQYTPQPKLKEVESGLSEMLPISYPSSDGLIIPGYLTTPSDGEDKLPLVVLVHGGPKGPRDYWCYNGLVQFLANRGYAVLQMNFRASGGYGKNFLNSGDKEWGRKMQDDITYGVKYLVDAGKIDETRVAIMGGSYGGYATLAGLTFTPELYACGVDIVGPSNLFTLLESIPPYWEAGRKWLYEMVGDPATEEGKKLLKERSPLFHCDAIVKPLMIIQGANDPRVKQAESDQIAKALLDKGKEVVYLNALDEGHGYRKPINRMAMYAEVEKFLAIHIGGRYQSEAPTEIISKVSELTVDIALI